MEARLDSSMAFQNSSLFDPPGSNEKAINESSSNESLRKNSESGLIGPRRITSSIPQGQYDMPTGGPPSKYSDTIHSNSQGRRDHSQHRPSHIRREVQQKHRNKIPGHLWFTKFMHTDLKNHLVAVLGEFIGTTLFLWFAFAGTEVANIPAGSLPGASTDTKVAGFNPATQLYISIIFGFSLMVNSWVFFRISGGLFNPAVTLALFLLKALHPLRAVLLFAAQIGGACFASFLVKVMFPVPFSVATTLTSGVSLTRGVFIEAICTAELVFTIIMLAKEKHRTTFIAPVGIGLSLFIGELVAIYYTGGSFNPARSFGPAAVSHSFNSDHWIYWVGPLIGTLISVFLYKLFKLLEYEMANPGQDRDVENDPTVNPDHEIAHAVEERGSAIKEIIAIQNEGGSDTLVEIPSGKGSIANQEGVTDTMQHHMDNGDDNMIKTRRKKSEEEDTKRSVGMRLARRADADLEAQWLGRRPRAKSSASKIPDPTAVTEALNAALGRMYG